MRFLQVAVALDKYWPTVRTDRPHKTPGVRISAEIPELGSLATGLLGSAAGGLVAPPKAEKVAVTLPPVLAEGRAIRALLWRSSFAEGE